MAKTLEQLLKEAGQTDDQIKGIVQTLGPAKGAFERELQEADRKNTEAAATLAKAQEKEQTINKFWNEEATPQINKAFSDKAAAEARANFYRTQNETARKDGFIPADAPGYEAPAAGAGAPAAGAGAPPANSNAVPGSPAYMTLEQGVRGISEAAFLITEHQRLFGEPLPNLEELMVEAGKSRRLARDVWAEKYDVPGRRKKIADDQTAAEKAKMRTEIEKEVRTELANKYGNPGEGPMVPSRYPNYVKDAKTGAPDKLAWTKPDKRETLRSRIMEQVNKESGSVH